MTPTTEQQAILAQCCDAPCLIINAGPGCAKSTTIAMIAHYIRKFGSTRWSCLATAFNKDAVKELSRKLPPLTPCKTINALGHEIWAKHLQVATGALKLDVRKMREILFGIQDDGRWSISPEEIDDLLDLFSAAKAQGYMPPKAGGAKLPQAPTFTELCEIANIVPAKHYEALVNVALKASITMAFKGIIDFDDQCYMSAYFAGAEAYPSLEFLFVDEAQDLTPLQLLLLKRINPKHVILVGDPLQAIYAFRGAMSDSMAQISKVWPSALHLPLQTSFRLPLRVVNLLKVHSPQLTTAIKYAGSVEILQGTYDMNQLQGLAVQSATKAILCRNNAPLFRVALACIASGTRFHMANTDFGKSIIRDIKKVCPNLQAASTDWMLAQLYTHWFYSDPQGPARYALLDKHAAVAAVAERCETAANVCFEIQSLLRQTNASDSSPGVFLSTAHKAKGLEFDWVLHLDSHLIPAPFATKPDELAQEANIAYVINSRTLHTLLFATSDQILIPGSTRRPANRPPIARNLPA